MLTNRRLSPNQIQKLLNQYLVADYEQPINGEIMKAVASRVTEKSDVLLLQAVDMDDSGPYEIAEPRVITALETYTPSCESSITYCILVDSAMLTRFQGSKPRASSGLQRSSPPRLLPSRRRWSTARRTATRTVPSKRWTRLPSLLRPAHRVRIGPGCGFRAPLSNSNPPGHSCCPRSRRWGASARQCLEEEVL